MTDTQPAAPERPAPSDEQARETAKVAPPTGVDWRHAFRDRVKDQLGVRGMISEYLIPVETNTFWYSLGGVLGISLFLEILTGFIVTLRYIPDAGRAYGITKSLLSEGGWSVVLNFHYWNAYLIFALVMIHMMRVFFSGGYRGAKKGLWQIGVALAGTVFLLSITGETLHYTREDLLNIPKATNLLIPYYALHVAILPILLLALISMHYYLIKVKGISLPFWHKPSGRRVPFSTHIREWLIYSVVILGAILVVSFFRRAPGPEPQLLPTSEFYGSEHGPGGLGIVPTFPITWTHGMNRFVNIAFGMEPDIWGTIIGMVLMTVALVAIPYLDRGGPYEPRNWGEALSLKRRGWAYLAIVVFWAIMVIGTVTNLVTPVG